jgi:murein DD-endopeptidase MepM/ murein hydrolase activator NlpD
MRLPQSFAALLVALLIAPAQAAPVRAKHWSVLYEPQRVVNGSAMLIRVTTPQQVRALAGTWLGHDLTFSFDERQKFWFALAGASIETKPGSYPLSLHAETTAGEALDFEKQIAVARQQYPQVKLTVPGKYTAPSPEEQQEIAEDKKVKDETFKTLTPAREWQGSFAAPVEAEISDVFGVARVFNGTTQSTHLGLDFRVPAGTPVAAVNRGTVILARPLFFEGNFIVIDHGQGLMTLYLHLSKFLVKEGETVDKGQQIGISGGTGRATGPHLHLAVRWQGTYLNPESLLKLKLP